MSIIEISRRTEEEMKAYKDGFRAGVHMAIDAIRSNQANMELLWLEEKEGDKEDDPGEKHHE